MTAEETRELIQEVEGTIAVFNAGLRGAMTVLRNEPLEVEVQVSHANVVTTVRKPNPALRRVREISSSLRALELRLKKLHAQEKEFLTEQKQKASPLAKWAPKERK
jgi:hypothetical protein